MTVKSPKHGAPAVYNASGVTYLDGDAAALQVDSAGNLKNTQSTTTAGEDITADVLKTEVRGSYINITTNATTVIKSTAGMFYGFTVNNNGFTTAGTITVYDNSAGSGTKIGTWVLAISPPGTTVLATDYVPAVQLSVAFATGLTFVTATTAPAADITVSYR